MQRRADLTRQGLDRRTLPVQLQDGAFRQGGCAAFPGGLSNRPLRGPCAVTEWLPAAIDPLRLRREPAPSGTKAVLVGYPKDRAFAMTADRDCELREKIDAGRLLLHTCRGVKGTSGAPILVSAGGGEMQIAGIQIATLQSDGTTKMIAVPAHAIRRHDSAEIREL